MPDREGEKGSWGEIFRDGRGLYSALVIGGIAMHATQMLVIAIIMPTIVADIGGAAYYTWAAMLYTIGAIVGASSTGVVWSRFGPRRGYALGAGVFAVSTAACALAPDIGALIAARAAQGWAGGLVAGSGMALITSLFDARLRTRIIAISQGTFTACHLSGPIVGGLFAAMNWWRGSFWTMVPFMLLFTWLAYYENPRPARHRSRAPAVSWLAAASVGYPRHRGVLHRRQWAGNGGEPAYSIDPRCGHAGCPDVSPRPRRCRQPVSPKRAVIQRADRAGAMDPCFSRHDPDFGDALSAVAAPGGPRGLADLHQLRQHRDLGSAGASAPSRSRAGREHASASPSSAAH